MTKIKKVQSTIQVGNEKKTFQRECYEVSIHEVEEMLKKVHAGGDENLLRNTLIKNSEW